MKEYSIEEEENVIKNSILSRLRIIEEDIQNIRKDMSEEVIKILNDSKKLDDAKEKNHSKNLTELETELKERLIRIEDELKVSHNEHVDERKMLVNEFEYQKNSNQKMLEECLKLMQKLEFLEMRIGKK